MLLIHSFTNKEQYEKCLCKESSQVWATSLIAHHVQPPNQCLSLSAKMNGTQRKSIKNAFNILKYVKCTFRAKAALNSEKINPVAYFL